MRELDAFAAVVYSSQIPGGVVEAEGDGLGDMEARCGLVGGGLTGNGGEERGEGVEEGEGMLESVWSRISGRVG